MNYRVILTRQAEMQMNDLPRQTWRRVTTAIQRLAENPRPPGSLKLKAEPARRIRVGDFRVVYKIDDRSRLATIRRINHRKDVYR